MPLRACRIRAALFVLALVGEALLVFEVDGALGGFMNAHAEAPLQTCSDLRICAVPSGQKSENRVQIRFNCGASAFGGVSVPCLDDSSIRTGGWIDEKLTIGCGVPGVGSFCKSGTSSRVHTSTHQCVWYAHGCRNRDSSDRRWPARIP